MHICRFIPALLAALSVAVLSLPAAAQTAGRAIDPGTLAKASERGAAMLKAPLWRLDRASAWAGVDSMLIARVGSLPPMTIIGALDMDTGKSRWEAQCRGSFSTITGSPNAQMVIISKDANQRGSSVGPRIGEMHVLNLVDGSTAWKIPYDAFIPLPTFAGKLLVVGARVNFQPMNAQPDPPTNVPMEVRAYDRQTGKPAWSWPIPHPSTGTVPYRSSAGTWASPAYGDGKVYFVLDQSEAGAARELQTLVALNADDGTPVWMEPVNASDVSSVAYADQLVVTAIENGNLVARDSATGEIKWHTAISPDADPAKSRFTQLFDGNQGLAPVHVDGDMVFVNAVGPTDPPSDTGQISTGGPTRGVLRSVNRSAGIAAFDLHSGKQRWFFPLLMPRGSFGAEGPNPVVLNHFAQLAIGKNSIVLSASGDYPNKAYAFMGLNRQSGELEWHFHPPTAGIVAIRGDTAYLSISAGSQDIAAGLYAISPDRATSPPK